MTGLWPGLLEPLDRVRPDISAPPATSTFICVILLTVPRNHARVREFAGSIREALWRGHGRNGPRSGEEMRTCATFAQRGGPVVCSASGLRRGCSTEPSLSFVPSYPTCASGVAARCISAELLHALAVRAGGVRRRRGGLVGRGGGGRCDRVGVGGGRPGRGGRASRCGSTAGRTFGPSTRSAASQTPSSMRSTATGAPPPGLPPEGLDAVVRGEETACPATSHPPRGL